jgi:hypothetical protein
MACNGKPLANFASSSMTKKNSFIKLRPGSDEHQLRSELLNLFQRHLFHLVIVNSLVHLPELQLEEISGAGLTEMLKNHLYQ